MPKRLIFALAVVLLAAGTMVVAGRWHESQVAECHRRSTDLAALDLLTVTPGDVQADAPFAGCDAERVVAYAGRQFTALTGPAVDTLTGRVAAAVDDGAVIAFYRRTLTAAAWQISSRAPAPGPGAAALCATRELPFGTAYVALSFPLAATYEVYVADAPGTGTALCA